VFFTPPPPPPPAAAAASSALRRMMGKGTEMHKRSLSTFAYVGTRLAFLVANPPAVSVTDV